MSAEANDGLIHTLKRSNILLYVGNGSQPASVMTALAHDLLPGTHRVIAVTAWDLTEDPDVFNDASVLVMPGGADLPYAAALSGEGNAAIRRFVESGGVYLGICAGGYYGCSRIEFRKDRLDEICGPRELAFFPGLAIGPIQDHAEPYDTTKRWALAVPVSSPEGGRFNSYYHGGGWFVPMTVETYQVLAWYDELPGRPAAVIVTPVGKGKAVLTGIHPEISPRYLSNELAAMGQGAILSHLPQRLAETDRARRTFWRGLLRECGLQGVEDE